MLDLVSAKFRHQIEVCARVGDAGVRNARLEKTAKDREKYWRYWKSLCRIVGVDPYLDAQRVTWEQKARTSVTFGGIVRRGICGNGKQVARGTVTTAFTSVGQEIAMVRGENPLKIGNGSSDKYISPIAMMLIGFGNEDPATEKKLPVDVDVVELCCELGLMLNATAKDRRVGDLILIAFYYLLRVGEYTCQRRSKRPKRTKQTVNFRLMDVAFFKKDGEGQLRRMEWSCTAEERLSADGATLKLTNQKNGWKNVCVHQHKNKKPRFCPVKALARVVNDMLTFTQDGEEFLSAFKNEKGVVQHVIAGDISKALKWAAAEKEYPARRGIPINLIDTHSLRSGGANALSLAGYKEHQIQKMGRWNGKTFKEYISEQLSNFSEGMSEDMSRTFNFVNIAAGGWTNDITDDMVASDYEPQLVEEEE